MQVRQNSIEVFGRNFLKILTAWIAPTIIWMTCASHAQVVTVIPGRTYEVTVDKINFTTAFVFEYDRRPHLVTVKHLFRSVSFPPTSTMFYRTTNGWKPMAVHIWYSARYDIALLQPPTDLLPEAAEGIPLCKEHLDVGQVLYFLGYPFGLHIDAKHVETLKGHASPFMKHAILSGVMDIDEQHSILVLDGINNEGFSGGPLLANDSSAWHFCTAGMITGYLYEAEPVRNEQNETTGQVVQQNTGLIFAVPATTLAELADQHRGAPKAK